VLAGIDLPLVRSLREPFGSTSFSEKLVKGTTHRLSTLTASGAAQVARMS
jgi:hypothetical protein